MRCHYARGMGVSDNPKLGTSDRYCAVCYCGRDDTKRHAVHVCASCGFTW